MLVRLFALRSWALNALIGLEPGTHRLVPTATVLAQTGLGCLRKSTACIVSQPRPVSKNGLGQRGFLADKMRAAGSSRGSRSSLAQAQLAAK